MKIVCALAAAAALSASASAGYVAQVVGLTPAGSTSPTLTLNPGDSFSAAVLLSGPPGIRHDSAFLRLAFSQPGLLHAPNWYHWSTPYITGGPDDFSSPSLASPGSITADTHLDPLFPTQIDIAFENLTPNFGDYFFTGQLLQFTLQVPHNAPRSNILISFAEGSFTDGESTLPATAATPLSITIIPTPAATLPLALTLVATQRRRRRCNPLR